MGVVHPVLIETAGNQRYIFATNRLRENAGASDLLFRAGTALVFEALASVFPGSPYGAPGGAATPETTAERLDALDRAAGGGGVEVVIATSGKALLLVDDAAKGRELVWRVTRAVLQRMPGLVMRGAVGAGIDLETCGVAGIHQAIKNIHAEAAKVAAWLPAPELRFPVLPFTQPCHSAALPAEALKNETERADSRRLPYSAAVLKRREAGQAGFSRISADLGPEIPIARSTDELDRLERIDWLAVVHADGNGFGALFLNFDARAVAAGVDGARGYLDLYRRFSASLERCGLTAFKTAVGALTALRKKGTEESFLPVAPMILGGDDLTAIVDGRQAIRFAETYLQAFEAATVEEKLLDVDNAIRTVSGGKRLGAAAGIAIVKPHYPFHRAYELAEDLLRSAKKSKVRLRTTGVSSLDFHILFDGGATDLETLRENWSVGAAGLTRRPYLVGDPGTPEHGADWAAPRRLDTLRKLCKDLSYDESDRDAGEARTLPRTQQHQLRDALFLGKAAADARLAAILNRYDKLEAALGGRSLFAPDPQHPDGSTMLIDAIELNDIEKAAATAETE